MLFSMPVDQTRLVMMGAISLDEELMELARSGGLELRALETAEE